MTVTTNPDVTGVPISDSGQPSQNHIFGTNIPAATDRDGIAQAQHVAGGQLTLNGAGIVGGIWSAGFTGGRKITVYSAGNLSSLNFSITGTDKDGAAQQEDITGPNNGTSTGTKFFKTVTIVFVDSDMGGTNAEIGFAASLVCLNVTDGPNFTLSPLAGETVTVAMYGSAGTGYRDTVYLKFVIPASGTFAFADGSTPTDVLVTWPGPSPTLTPSTTQFFTFMADGTTSGNDTVWYGDEYDFGNLVDHLHTATGDGGLLVIDNAVAGANKTGSGKAVLDTSPTIVTPTIASFTNATHTHASDAGGGTLGDSAFSTSATIAKDGSAVMPIAFDRDGIAQSQTPGAAGNLTLNGAQVSGGVFTATHLGGWLLSFYSAGNDSGRTFTITGTNAVTGGADTEAVVGPNAGIVVSTKYWSAVTQIAVDAAAAAAVEVGFHFPLISVAATARGRLVNIINVISGVTNLVTKTMPGLAIFLPAALWRQSGGFSFEWLMTFATGGGGNKNPVFALGSTTIKDFGAANLGSANPLWVKGEILKTATNTQRTELFYYLGGLIGLGLVTASTESEASGITIKLYPYTLEDTTGVGQIESFALDMRNTP